jgi:hypothetical protein
VRSLGAIALTCVGVLVMVATLRLIQTAVLLSSGGVGAPLIVAVVAWLTVVAEFVVGLWLVCRRNALATRWFEESSYQITLGPRPLLRLALIVVGVVFVALAIPGLVQTIATGVVQSTGSDFEGVQLSWDWGNFVPAILYPLAQLVVGALLLIFSERLARRFWPVSDVPVAGEAHPGRTDETPVAQP